MNTAMWDHPLTQLQLRTIQGFWNSSQQLPSSLPIKQAARTAAGASLSCKRNKVRIISPQVKVLACGEVGNGALASVDEILKVCQSFKNTQHVGSL